MRIPVSSQFKLYLLCCFVSLGGFIYGYDSGVISIVSLVPSFQQEYELYAYTRARFALVPVSLAASFVASFISGFVADRLGRKRFFYVASILHEIGCVIQIAGETQAAFFAGRIITGFAIGIFSMLVPLYQSEIAKPTNRGRLITLYQIFVTLGFFVAFWVGYGTYSLTSKTWIIPVSVQLVPGFLILCGTPVIPESPRWLIYKDRNAEALKILAKLRSHGNEQNVEVQMEYTGILQDVSFDKMAYRQRFVSLLRKGNDNNRRRTLLGIGIHIFTQLSGINALLFYLPYVLKSAGLKEITSALLGNGVAGAISFVATSVVLLYIDKWGRRRILTTGGIAMAICMIIISIVSATFGQHLVKSPGSYGGYISIINNTSASYVTIILLCIFLIFFALSRGPIGWIYPAEIYPQMIRANAMGVTTSCSYLFNLFISMISPVMFRHTLWGAYLFFALMCVIMAIVVHRYYPETCGRSLEEIQLIFSGALIDQKPDAHHPATAAEALLHLEQIQHKDRVNQMRSSHVQQPFSFDASPQWPEIIEVSSPRDVSRALNNHHQTPKPPPSQPKISSSPPLAHGPHYEEVVPPSTSIKDWVDTNAQFAAHSDISSIELSIQPSGSKRSSHNTNNTDISEQT